MYYDRNIDISIFASKAETKLQYTKSSKYLMSKNDAKTLETFPIFAQKIHLQRRKM